MQGRKKKGKAACGGEAEQEGADKSLPLVVLEVGVLGRLK